jgi:DNA-binding NarL/FixJ family response regulator
MEFRRALVVHFLKEWAASEKVELISLPPEQAHEALHEGIGCRMIIFNAGVASCSSSGTLAEIRVLRALAPDAPLVVVADEEVSSDVVAVMQSGAEGYLSNHCAPDLVPRALSFVLQGGTYFPRSAIAHWPSPDETPLKASSGAPSPAGATPASGGIGGSFPSAPLPELSERQMAILQGLCRGEPNKIIGRALNLPESTVKVHVREIMRKLSVSNRTQVAIVVSRMGTALLDEPGVDKNFRAGWHGEELPEAARKLPICPADSSAAAAKACANKGNVRSFNPRRPSAQSTQPDRAESRA